MDNELEKKLASANMLALYAELDAKDAEIADLHWKLDNPVRSCQCSDDEACAHVQRAEAAEAEIARLRRSFDGHVYVKDAEYALLCASAKDPGLLVQIKRLQVAALQRVREMEDTLAAKNAEIARLKIQAEQSSRVCERELRKSLGQGEGTRAELEQLREVTELFLKMDGRSNLTHIKTMFREALEGVYYADFPPTD